MSGSGSTSRSALTLVEMLITMALMALVAGAIVAALTSGFKVYQRAREAGTTTQRAMIAFDETNKDLRSYREFGLVKFEGDYDAFTFPVARRAAGDPSLPLELGGLTYFLDAKRKALCRSFVPFRLSRRMRYERPCEAVLDDVSRLRFEYFGAEEPDGVASWAGSWESRRAPLAVKASVTTEEPGRRPVSHTWFISLARQTPPPKP